MKTISRSITANPGPAVDDDLVDGVDSRIKDLVFLANPRPRRGDVVDITWSVQMRIRWDGKEWVFD